MFWIEEKNQNDWCNEVLICYLVDFMNGICFVVLLIFSESIMLIKHQMDGEWKQMSISHPLFYRIFIIYSTDINTIYYLWFYLFESMIKHLKRKKKWKKKPHSIWCELLELFR